MSSERELYFDKLGIPRIYCYTTPEFENAVWSSDSSKKGFIKVGYTLKQSVEEVKLAMEDHVTSQDVMNMLFMTQHYETVSKLGDNNNSTIFMPYSPDNVGDLQMQIQSSLIAVEELKKKKKQQTKS